MFYATSSLVSSVSLSSYAICTCYIYPYFFWWFSCSCLTLAETQCWQEWLIFADIFFFLMKSGCIDFLDFINKIASRVTKGDQQILRSNHVTWLLAQIIRIEIVTSTLSSDPKKVVFVHKSVVLCIFKVLRGVNACLLIFLCYLFCFSKKYFTSKI